MTDSESGPDADPVSREFEMARQMLSDAATAQEVDISTATIINRLYYACFHAAQGALYARGYSPRSHGRVQTVLGQELVQSGDLPREYGRFLNDMATYRRRVDYGSGRVDRDTAELVENTRSFIDALRELTPDGADDPE